MGFIFPATSESQTKKREQLKNEGNLERKGETL